MAGGASAPPGTKAGASALLLLATLGAGLCTPPAQGQEARIAIESPKQEETVHDNAGNVAVSLAIHGTAPAGMRVRVLLDGRPHGAEQATTSFVIEGIERGEHLLQVELVDAAGRVVAASETVTFFMWQASSLFPSRKK